MINLVMKKGLAKANIINSTDDRESLGDNNGDVEVKSLMVSMEKIKEAPIMISLTMIIVMMKSLAKIKSLVTQIEH